MSEAPGTLLDGILEAAHATPDRTAVRDTSGALSYAELLGQACAMALELIAAGVSPGARVAVELAPSCGAVVAYVAVMLAGGAYVPVDVTLPPERRDLLVRVARVAARIGPPPRALAPVGAPALAGPRASDVAFVIHTSGSTGVPKAVQVEHRNLLTTIGGMDDRAPIPDGFVGTWWASPGFDAAAWEIWSVLSRGGTLVVVRPVDRLEPERFFAVLSREGVQSCFLPPLFVPDFVRAVEADPTRFAALRRMLVGAEPVQLDLLQRAVRAAAELQVVNGYGPAEASVFCTLYDVAPTGGDPLARTPVGRALPGVAVELDSVDADGVGEIVIHGGGVARGYLGDDPGGFGSVEGVRRYATGDLGRIDARGDLVFCGRRDRQLKVRGFRVEAGEIEAALAGLDEVEVAVAGLREIDGVGKAVVAYVVLVAPVGLREIRTRLADRLPYYALPLAIVRLERIPVTPNGKVDHARLDRLPLDADEAPESPTPYAGDDELARLVAEEVPGGLGPDSVIAAGVTSLGAARLARRIRAALGREVTADQVLRAGGWDDLQRVVALAPSVIPAEVSAPSGEPLVFDSQLTGMWFHEQLLRRPEAYRQTVAFRLRDGVDVERLARCVEGVLGRHPVLTAAVAEKDGVPAYELDRVQPRCPPAESVSAVGDDVRIDGALCRAGIVWAAAGSPALVLVFHHLAVDYWTVQQVLTEVAERYDGSAPVDDVGPDAATRPAALAAALAHRRDRERRLVDSGAVSARARELLADAARWPLVPTGRGDRASLTFEVDPAGYQRALVVVAQGRHTLAEVLVELVERSLCEAWRAPVVPYGLAVGDRATMPGSRVAGCFVDTVLLLARSRTDEPDALRSCAEDLRAALAPEVRIPFALAVQGLRSGGPGGAVSAPACFLALEESPRLTLTGTEQEPLEVGGNREDFGFTVFVSASADRCTGEVRFDDVARQREAAVALVSALSTGRSDRA